jgi:hypothetical protein
MTKAAGGIIAINDVVTVTTPLVLSGGAVDAGSFVWCSGDLAGVVFNFDKGVNATNTQIATIPTDCLPPWEIGVSLDANGANPARVFARITSAGAVMLTWYGTDSTGARLRGTGTWPRVI